MIKHIIFDLGGVILNLNQDLTLHAFKKLGIDLAEINSKSSVFTDYEIGKISDEEFRDTIKNLCKTQFTIEQFDHAWNRMLLDLPKNRIEILKQLKNDFNLFLLSNTNAIHIHSFLSYFNQTHKNESFEALFNKVYYSHKMGCRKPDSDCFNLVLSENDLTAHNTLFIDDSPTNIKGAEKLGIKTILAKKPIDEWLFDAINAVKKG
ncbi:MAG: HAD family hydrolase [Bacteroidia bacterium]